MSDDPLDPARGELERQLGDLYRSLEGPAQRIESRWRAEARRPARVTWPAWLGAGTAAAALILLVLLALRPARVAPDRNVARDPAPPPAPRNVPVREFNRPPSTPPVAPAPAPPVSPPEKPRTETPQPAVPEPTPANPVPAPATPPRPEGPKPPQPPTRTERAVAVIPEVEGSGDVGDFSWKGKQKDVLITAGDTLRTTSVVKITLAPDRFLLAAPKTVVTFQPVEKRLGLFLEQGEILAELIGPGMEIRVATKFCEATPLGTVFSVKAEERRASVIVEKGKVEVRTPKGEAVLRATQGVTASSDGTLGVPATADLRGLGWAAKHRPVERVLLFEDFLQPGWSGEIDRGAARALFKEGAGPVIASPTTKAPLFEVPVRGQVAIVCRADRASKLRIRLYCPEPKNTYSVFVPILRGATWRTITLDLSEFAVDAGQGKIAPGTPIHDIIIYYGDIEERGNFWVDSIRITEQR